MRRMVFSALFVAFGLLLPMVFHAVGLGGPVFLPMHIPVLVGGLVLGPGAGLVIGLITPLLSSMLTGMPPMGSPILLLMTIELAVYGLTAGALMKWRGNLLLSLGGAMLSGRIAMGLAVALVRLAIPFPGTPVAYVTGSVLSSLPGLAIQIVVVPLLAAALLRTPVGLLAREAQS
jgi:riboflavin transporter FmnP